MATVVKVEVTAVFLYRNRWSNNVLDISQRNIIPYLNLNEKLVVYETMRRIMNSGLTMDGPELKLLQSTVASLKPIELKKCTPNEEPSLVRIYHK